MTLQDQLNDDLKTAMRSQDTLTKDTIRLMRAAIKNAEIEKRNELSEEAVIEVLSKMAKQYRDSITTYTDNGREDLAKKEKDELEVLIRYLPAQLSEFGANNGLELANIKTLLLFFLLLFKLQLFK